MHRAFIITAALAMLLAAVVSASCSDDERPAPSSPATETATPVAAMTASPTAITAAPPPGALRPPTGVAMIDLASGKALPLFEGEGFANTRGFEADGTVWVRVSPPVDAPVTWQVFDAEGKRLPDLPAGTPPASCSPVPGASGCGVPSPGGEHVLYFVDIEGPDVRLGRYAAWLLTVASGSTRQLTASLRHCGGCDGFAGPAWSPSGRYVLFGETYSGPDSTAYVADAETGEVRPIGKAPSMFALGVQPRWSPAQDSFVARSDNGTSIVEQLESGTTVRFPEVSWPAAFDETGQYVYSLGRTTIPRPGLQTAVASVATGNVVQTWSGQATNWPVTRGVAAYRGAPIALLEQADGCTGGIVIHHPLVAGGERCIDQARGGAWNPSFNVIAIARERPYERTAPALSGAVWSIHHIDLATGREIKLIDGLRSEAAYPPLIRWSADGKRLLVSWPSPSGI